MRFENCHCAVASASRPPCPGLAPAADVPCRGSSFAAATVRTAVGSTPWGSPWPSTAVPCVDVRRRAMPSRAFLCPRCPLCRRRVSFQLTAAVAPRFNWSCPQLRWVASNLSRPSYQPVALSCVPISKGRALGPLRPEALRRRLSSPPKQLGQIPRTTSPLFVGCHHARPILNPTAVAHPVARPCHCRALLHSSRARGRLGLSHLRSLLHVFQFRGESLVLVHSLFCPGRAVVHRNGIAALAGCLPSWSVHAATSRRLCLRPVVCVRT